MRKYIIGFIGGVLFGAAIPAAAAHAAHPLPVMLFRPASTGACALPRFPALCHQEM